MTDLLKFSFTPQVMIILSKLDLLFYFYKQNSYYIKKLQINF